MDVKIDELNLSRLIFGTMRMSADNASLLNSMYEKGIDTHHISYEYDSYVLYQKLHQQLKKERKYIKHIAKIAAPDFKEDKFDAEGFEKRINDELVRLGKDQLEVVQWMFRMENLNDEVRLAIFNRDYEEMQATFERLKKAGKVLAFGHFPYTPLFANKIAATGLTSVLLTYLNAFELSFQQCVEQLPTIAIRPFAAGKIKEILSNDTAMQHVVKTSNLTEIQAQACIQLLPFLFPTVKGVIVSLNSEQQLHGILAADCEMQELKRDFYDAKAIVNSINEAVQLIN